MRYSVDLRSSLLPVVASLMSLLAVSVGSQAIAADGFSGSLVGGLADLSDLSPLMAADASVAVPAARGAAVGGSTSLGRQSVPAADRSTSYRGGEVFANSKVAVPLLVADLEPKSVSLARPMSGRSVGARPSASWTRSRGIPGGAAKNQDVQPSMAWSGLSGR